MKRLDILPVIVLLVLFCAGCGAPVAVKLLESPELTALKAAEGTAPIPGRTMVVCCDPGKYAEVFNAVDAEAENTWIPAFDPQAETDEIAALLERLAVFDGTLVSKLLPAESSRESAINEAWQRGFDFVLLPTVKDYRVYFAGHAGTYVGNMFLWFALWVPSWFVHTEIYAAEAEVEMALVDVYSRTDIIRKTYSDKTERRLNEFGRGWKFFGVFNVPGSLNADNWTKITEHVLPETMNGIKMKFLGDFCNGVVREITRREAFKRAVRKTLVLSIGVSEYAQASISPVPFAAEDASRVFDVLQADGKAREGYSRLLTNGMAGKSDILAALTELGGRARNGDVLVVYFTGYGTTVKNAEEQAQPCLVPFDAVPERLAETCILLAEIAETLKNTSATDICLIVDTAFGATAAGKTLAREAVPDLGSAAAAFDERVALFTAGSGSQPANIFSELKGGLFTYYILEALSGGKGDTNKDGLVTMKEAFQYAENRVKMTSEFRGRSQVPVWLGNTGTTAILTGSDKEQAIQAVMTQLGADTIEEIELK